MREIDFAYHVGQIIPVYGIASGSLQVIEMKYIESEFNRGVFYNCWTRTTEMKYLLLTEQEIEGLRFKP